MASGEAPRERTYQGIRTGGRSERVRAAVLAAATQELLRVGYADLSMAKVAEVADVALTTVHRRWGSKAGLAADAIDDFLAQEVVIADLGSLERDLRGLADAAVNAFAEPTFLALMRTVMLLHPPELDRIQARLDEIARSIADQIVGRATARGELASPKEPLRVIELLLAGLWMRGFVSGGPLDEREVEAFVADAIAAAGALEPA